MIFLFVLAVGAFITVTMKTGAIQTGIGRLALRFQHSGSVLIAILMGVFALGGTTLRHVGGDAGLLRPARAADAGARLRPDRRRLDHLPRRRHGRDCSTVNPFATGVASDAAGISLGDGIGLRIADVGRARRRWRSATSLCTRAASGATRAGRSSGSRPTDATDARGLIDDVPALTGRQKLVLILFAGAFLVMIYGFIPWNDLWQEGWGTDFPLPTFASFYFPEAAALFFVMAVVIGLIAKLGEEGTVNTIVAGRVRLPRRRADHRARARDHGRDEEHLHDRHRPALDGGRGLRHLAGRVRRDRRCSSTSRSRSWCRRRPGTPRW